MKSYVYLEQSFFQADSTTAIINIKTFYFSVFSESVRFIIRVRSSFGNIMH